VKKKISMKKLSLYLTTFGLSLSTVIMPFGAIAETNTFFDRNAEGWFWYDDPVEEEPAEEPEPPEPTPIAIAPPPTTPSPAPEVEPSPPPGSVAFLRQAMPLALDIATDNPTPENVERYMLLQKQAMDKSEVFSEMVRQVTTGHPELDEGRRRPHQDTFAKLLEESAEENKRAVLTEFFKENALIMFMDGSCSSCGLMAENFYRMEQTHGLVWQSVSLDGSLLPESLSTNQSFDAGLSERLGVTQGGAVFIARPPETFIPVTWNPTGGAEIAERILLVARRAGLIDDETFRSTQNINARIGGVDPIPTGELPDILKKADAYLKPQTITFSDMEQAQ
jgi:conjugal transfer pilus assembly protein TraF